MKTCTRITVYILTIKRKCWCTCMQGEMTVYIINHIYLAIIIMPFYLENIIWNDTSDNDHVLGSCYPHHPSYCYEGYLWLNLSSVNSHLYIKTGNSVFCLPPKKVIEQYARRITFACVSWQTSWQTLLAGQWAQPGLLVLAQNTSITQESYCCCKCQACYHIESRRL